MVVIGGPVLAARKRWQSTFATATLGPTRHETLRTGHTSPGKPNVRNDQEFHSIRAPSFDAYWIVWFETQLLELN
jgi:hypothetical protein